MPLPNYPYNDNIPNAPNNPSTDQPNMKTNTNSTRSYLKEDHVDFGTSGSGLHNKTRLLNQSGLPSGVQSGMGTLYTKKVGLTGTTESSLFYTPGSSGKQYQMSRTDTSNFSSFGTNNTFTWGGMPANSAATGGWTFLPGGLMLSYGSYYKTNGSSVGGSGTVNFVIPFLTSVYSINLITNGNFACGVSSVSITGFSFSITGTTVFDPDKIYWMAIGV